MIIQKFGGVAMRDQKSRATCIHHIKEAIQLHKSVIVVVSAMGRAGDPYSTDTLIHLSDAFKQAPESQDLAAICGELLAISVLSAELLQKQIPCHLAYGVQAGLFTDDNFGEASILKTSTNSISEILQIVPCVIVPGFQGITTDNRFTTLGRGGSDLTAILLAVLFKSKTVEFYKDVPGVMTEDPKKHEDAKMLKEVSYKELVKYCLKGHPIIQKKAVDMAAKNHIHLHIRQFGSPLEGTHVSP